MACTAASKYTQSKPLIPKSRVPITFRSNKSIHKISIHKYTYTCLPVVSYKCLEREMRVNCLCSSHVHRSDNLKERLMRLSLKPSAATLHATSSRRRTLTSLVAVSPRATLPVVALRCSSSSILRLVCHGAPSEALTVCGRLTSPHLPSFTSSVTLRPLPPSAPPWNRKEAGLVLLKVIA